MTLKVGDIGEKNLVKYILSLSSDIVSDDAAITPVTSTNLISTCDMMIQSRHFPEDMSFYDMGFKAVTVNVSDLAAMGAEPLGFLLALSVPKFLEFESFKEILDGVVEACKHYSISFIGGDLNESSEIIATGTAFGTCNKPLMKNTYNIGDFVAITGDIGLAAIGFHLKNSKHALKPRAKIKEALILRDYATSATDITDGLASELYEMKREGLGFMIYEDNLNISDEYKCLSRKLNLNYLDLILYVGEDFELVFTISKDDVNKLQIDFKVIGEVTSSNKVEMTLSDKSVIELKNKGYEHYVSE